MPADPPLILVADDDKDFRDILADFLQAKGFLVKTANNGDDAVKMARKFHPRLILMDIAMPEKDGIAATFELQQDPHTKDIKIMYVSNLGDASWSAITEINRRLSRQIGAVDYFKKGGDLEILLSDIRSHLAQP